jgi:hypothetical protein
MSFLDFLEASIARRHAGDLPKRIVPQTQPELVAGPPTQNSTGGSAAVTSPRPSIPNPAPVVEQSAGVRKAQFRRAVLLNSETMLLALAKQVCGTNPPAHLLEHKIGVNKAYDVVAMNLNTVDSFSKEGGITGKMCREVINQQLDMRAVMNKVWFDVHEF